MGRSTLYVDGFNFYYGVTSYWRNTPEHLAGLGWCDFRALIERNFPSANAQLDIKYFTAPVLLEDETPSHRRDEHERYAVWARAVRTISRIMVVEGFYKAKSRAASGVRANDEGINPDAPAKSREEKQSDINLAVEVILDALSSDAPERVYLLSDDSDLMPVVFALQERIPVSVEVVVLLPSRANKVRWQDGYAATAKRLTSLCVARHAHPRGPTVELLTQDILANSLLGYTLRDPDGEFECLKEWQLSHEFLERHCAKPAWRPDACTASTLQMSRDANRD